LERLFELGKYGTADTLHEQRFQKLVGASVGSFTRKGKKNFSTIVMLTTWTIWQERNGHVFRNVINTIHQIMEQIKTDAKYWAWASRGHFTLTAIDE
jgi:hypothetical protein